MKHFFRPFLLPLCLVLLAASSCTKTNDPTPALSGDIVGYVNSVDENGVQQSKNGVMVTLEGANNQQATTDANGRYEFSNISAGTYNVAYSRTGYGTLRRTSIAHSGGSQADFLGTATISQVSTTLVSSLTATPANYGYQLSFTITAPTANNSFRYALLASTSNSFNPSTGTLVLLSTVSSSIAPTTTYSTSTSLLKSTLNGAGFASGTTLYLAMYGSTAVTASYVDPATGRTVYPNLNNSSSNVVAITVP